MLRRSGEMLWRSHRCLRRRTFSSTSAKSTFGVVMDIDGVLYRGTEVLPGAVDTIELLRKNRVPHLFMTNGGGQTEDERADILSKKLGLKINSDQLQLAHTPMKALIPEYGSKLVLVVGKEKAKEISESYGFRNIVTVDEYHEQFPHLYPDIEPRAVPKVDRFHEPIGAVLVFMDPLIWSREMQILCDVLRSDGRPGTIADKQVVPIFFSCPDFEYVTEYHLPRFGSGVFGRLLEHLYESATNRPLQSTWYGKPDKLSYYFAESTMEEQAKQMGYKGVHRYYMIGDNPESDIAGALGAGHHWTGVLVKTGVYKEGQPTRFDPHHITESVRTALDLIFEEEG